ncbi:DUF5819 family protein [Streptomyces sp. NPDC048383]|uniref:DUF5819 family protein n=1 Tax=Streptomyces sp. NPDC048383 TaxID=3155386 RepID=UPI003427FB9C
MFAVAAVMVAAALHMTMLFLNNAPPNALSRQHAAVINKYVAPEFTQEWQLFAPNPQSANIHVQARAQVLMPNGRDGLGLTETDWVDLTAIDEKGILHHPFPSEANQNELRLAWTNYIYSLDDQGRPIGQFGELTQRLLLRLAVDRLEPRIDGGTIRSVQLRSAVTPVGAPSWSDQRIDTRTAYLVQPWWAVGAEDLK